jgi:hypothetical protein
MSIINHLEEYLGKITKGWKDESISHLTAARFKDEPFEGATTFSTLGLSDLIHTLENGKTFRQELLFSTYSYFSQEQVASFLLTFAEFLLSNKKALLRGDIIGPSTPIIIGTEMNSIYVTNPIVFDEKLAVYGGLIPPTIVIWLVPVYEVEANYIRNNGWSKFESILEQCQPDFWDLKRQALF